jgi:hypothetical protein
MSASGFMEPFFTHYNSSLKSQVALCDALNRHFVPIPPIPEGYVGDRLRPITFLPSETGVLIESPYLTVPLEYFSPYLSMLTTTELYGTVQRSFGRSTQGVVCEEFTANQKKFLTRTAVPAIADSKIEAADRTADRMIRFGIKSIGIGDHGSEFGWILGMLLHHLEGRKKFKGDVEVSCIAFDVRLRSLKEPGKDILKGLEKVANDSKLKGRVKVNYRPYYGDLMDPRILSTMLLYGEADFALWRRTHVLRLPEAAVDLGDRIVDGLKQGLKRPGALIVQERMIPIGEDPEPWLIKNELI